MILTEIRSESQIDFSKNNYRIVVFNMKHESAIVYRYAIVSPTLKSINNYSSKDKKSNVYVFQTIIGSEISLHKEFSSQKFPKGFDFLKSNMNSVISFKEISSYCTQLYLVDEDSFDIINSINLSNKKLLMPLLSKNNYNSTEDIIKNINFLIAYHLFEDKPNILAWAIKNLYNGNLYANKIFTIKNYIAKLGQNINKLSKNTICAYNTSDDIDYLICELTYLYYEKLANISINKFNTMQKRMLKSNPLPKKYLFNLIAFNKLSEAKQLNFIKKISSIDNLDEIMVLLSNLCRNKYNWNINDVISYIKDEKLNCDIIYAKDNFLITEVKDYLTIYKLGINTNWCIAKQKGYWQDYVGDYGRKHNKQYIIWNFNVKEDHNLSQIGVTVNDKKGIIHSHSFINENLISNILNNCYNIYSILKLYNIKLHVIYDAFNKIDEKKIRKYIENNCIILSKKENKILFRGPSLSFLNTENMEGPFNDIIGIADFSTHPIDLIFAPILTLKETCEYVGDFYKAENVSKKLDLNLSTVLNEFGIDDYFLSRNNSVLMKILAAILEKNYDLINSIIRKVGYEVLIENTEVNRRLFYLCQEACDKGDKRIFELLSSNNIKYNDVIIGNKCFNMLFQCLSKKIVYNSLTINTNMSYDTMNYDNISSFSSYKKYNESIDIMYMIIDSDIKLLGDAVHALYSFIERSLDSSRMKINFYLKIFIIDFINKYYKAMIKENNTFYNSFIEICFKTKDEDIINLIYNCGMINNSYIVNIAIKYLDSNNEIYKKLLNGHKKIDYFEKFPL